MLRPQRSLVEFEVGRAERDGRRRRGAHRRALLAARRALRAGALAARQRLYRLHSAGR